MNEQNEFVQNFKNKFALKFGFYPTVTLHEKDPACIVGHNLESLKDIIDRFTDDKSQTICCPSRKRSIINLRNIYCMLAADLGYKYKTIGRYINRNHATIIHAIKSGYDLLESDKDFQLLYIQISTQLNPEIYPDARISETPDETSFDSESTGSTRMHTRRYYVTRPPSRQAAKYRCIKD